MYHVCFDGRRQNRHIPKIGILLARNLAVGKVIALFIVCDPKQNCNSYNIHTPQSCDKLNKFKVTIVYTVIRAVLYAHGFPI